MQFFINEFCFLFFQRKSQGYIKSIGLLYNFFIFINGKYKMLCIFVCNVIKYLDCVFLKDNNEFLMNLEL